MRRMVKLTTLALAGSIALSSASFALDKNSGSAQERNACTPDVMNLCSAQIMSGVDAIVACLSQKKKERKLSVACAKVIK